MHTCRKCGDEKAADAMLQRKGKPSKVCLACFGKAMKRGVVEESGGGQPRKKDEPL